MRPDERDAAHLWDMLDAARAVREFVAGAGFEQYLADRMLRSAVEREVQNTGEAARKVSGEFQQAHPEIPWRGMIAQRHVFAHEYGEIRHERLWVVATERIPELIAALEPLVPPPPEGEVT